MDRVKILNSSKNFSDHLKNYEHVDLALDTFPYNGVTTTFEALWKGVPVLTIQGTNFNSRCGSSILYNLGLNYLIANDESDYLLKASELSLNFQMLKNLRDEIFNNLLNTKLFKSKNFANDFESNIIKIIKERLI